MTTSQTAKLYGVGVGPGDPDLLTLKAARILGQVPVVFAACSPKNDYSLALSIAEAHIGADAECRRLPFPMTRDRKVLKEAWEANARAVLSELDKGRDCAFVTLGDPLTFSTYGYLMQTLLELRPDAQVETVPGITSYHAAAARINKPLCEGGESLLVLSGIQESEDLGQLMARADNMVILKAYRNYDQLAGMLAGQHDIGDCHLVSNCGLEGETVVDDASRQVGQERPYLSLIIAKRNNGHHP